MAKILVVDDEPHIVDLLCNYLKLEGYDVVGVTSPREAMRLIQAGGVWIVFLDLMMPEMSGLDLVREIKKFDGMIHLVAMTGNVTIENILSAFRLGISDCFFKPFETLEALKHEVETAFAKRKRVNQVLADLRNLKAS